MIDKNLVVYSSLSVAIMTTGIATWALLKLYGTLEKLRKYTEKYTQMQVVQQYLVNHFSHLDDFPHLKKVIPKSCEKYHARLAQFTSDTCMQYGVPKGRILDVGCGPGALSFYLSSTFKEVVGTDTSVSMIMAGQQMKQFAEFGSPFSTEGGKYISLLRLRVPDCAIRERVVFWDEDVCALLYSCEKFECVLVSNTLTDMHDPKTFLENIGEFVQVGGLLIISDVYNWENGPEGSLGGEGDVTTFLKLKEILNLSWEFQKEANMPYYFPKCARLAEIGNAHVTVWKKKNNFPEVKD